METILVLTDFSYSAFNAARYAVNLANQLHAAQVIFYHSFNPSATDAPPPFASEIDDLWGQAIERLNQLKTSLEGFAHHSTKLTLKISQEPLSSAIKTINKEIPIGLVVMGSTGNNKLKRLFVGSNTMSLSDICPAPLLVIPPDTGFENIERAVFVCDLQNTKQIPVHTIKSFLNQLQSKLSVLYFDEGNARSDNNLKRQKALLQLVDSINPESSYLHGEDIVDDIINFSNKNNMQLIIVIYKKQRFLQNIFHPGSTNRLAYYSHFPLLILKPLNTNSRSQINKHSSATKTAHIH